MQNGGLAVIKRQFSTTDKGQVNYRAEYACLERFADTHARKFLSGSRPPTPIPSAVLSLRLQKPPELIEVQTETINGITHFIASYAAYTSDVELETSTETSLSSISGTRKYKYYRSVFVPGGIALREYTYTRNWRAQLIITSVTTTRQGRGAVGGGFSGGAGYSIISREGPVPQLSSSSVTLSRTYTNSEGQVRTETTSTVIVSAPLSDE